jgi:hypothetical protein
LKGEAKARRSCARIADTKLQHTRSYVGADTIQTYDWPVSLIILVFEQEYRVYFVPKQEKKQPTPRLRWLLTTGAIVLQCGCNLVVDYA